MQIRSVDTLLKDTLATHCSTVARLYTTKKSQTFILYHLVDTAPQNYSDDARQGTEYYYRIDIFSKQDYLTLIEEIVKSLEENDFYGIKLNEEMIETETSYYHIPMDVYFFDNEDNDESEE